MHLVEQEINMLIGKEWVIYINSVRIYFVQFLCSNFILGKIWGISNTDINESIVSTDII